VAVTAAATTPTLDPERTSPAQVEYELLLLHGIPVGLVQALPAGVEEGDAVFVRGEEWTVAAVRDGAGRPRLVCIRGL